MSRIAKTIRQMSRDAMASTGTASGPGNRARTQRSKRDKETDPRRQRKNWRQSKE